MSSPRRTNIEKTYIWLVWSMIFGFVSGNQVFANETLDELMFAGEFGSRGSQPGQFINPYGVAIDSQNRIIVADTRNHRIQVCDESGSCTAFGGPGGSPGQFNFPNGIAIDSRDRIIVADTQNDRIQICDSEGTCEVLSDAEGTPRVFDEPQDVATDSVDRIVITEPSRASYHVCIDGGDCFSFDDIDGQTNLFVRPETVAVDPQDHFVFMTSFDEVWTCDDQGVCKKMFGGHGDAPGEFSSPQGLTVDESSRIIIADQGNGRIQLCELMGNCDAFDVHRTEKQLFWWPAGVAMDNNGRLIVSEREGHHIQVYELVQIDAPAIPINAGLNDAWYDPATPGQGFFINVFDQVTQTMFVTWFTYDVERPDESTPSNLADPGHRWLTGQGIYNTYTAALDIFLTEGGVFLDNSHETTTSPYGEMNLRFRDCGTGTITYDIPSVGQHGEIPIYRLTDDSAQLCRELLE